VRARRAPAAGAIGAPPAAAAGAKRRDERTLTGDSYSPGMRPVDVGATPGAGPPTKHWIPWLAAIDRRTLWTFAAEVAAAVRLSAATGDAEALRDVLHAWRSTAEYELAGAPLSHDTDWDTALRLSRPAANEDRTPR